jgi:hypothetical protein
MTDFYTIETPPSSSSTSKDSLDESMSSFHPNHPIKLTSTNLGQIPNQSKSIGSKTDEVGISFHNKIVGTYVNL